MSERRRALIARFRAGSLDRLRRTSLALMDLEHDGANDARMQEVQRELHTLKGEATMLGFHPLGELVHAAEDRLKAADQPVDVVRAAKEVLASVDAMNRWLNADEGDDAATASLVLAREALQGPSDDRPVVPTTPPAKTLTAEPPAHSAPPAAKPANQRWVQVSAQRIDTLCERVLDFEGDFRSLYYRLAELARSPTKDLRGLRAIVTDFDRCQTGLEDITTAAWAMRLVPLEPALVDLVAHAREIAAAQHKSVRTIVEGGSVQIERTVLDTLGEPLLHIVRNAVDHGIEAPGERGDKGEAKLVLRGEAVGAKVVLTIADDGRGIDPRKVVGAALARGIVSMERAGELDDHQALELLFVHGFSTKSEVTALSGRGVGLDIVRASVEGVGGTVAIASEPGRGTTFTLTLPAAISKELNLVVGTDDGLFAIPSRNVVALLRLADQRVEQVAGGQALIFDDKAVPLTSLLAVLGGERSAAEPWSVIVEASGSRWAFAIPKPLGEYALLRRPLDKLAALAPLLSASATFIDGRLVLILSVTGLTRHAPSAVAARPKDAAPRRPKLLMVDDSAIVRDLIGELLRAAGIDVREAADGFQALAALSEERPDGVLLDIDMPRMDGFEVLRRIRVDAPNLPVIMLTLRASPDDQRRAASLGATAYIVKTHFQETALVDTIRRHIGART